MPHRIECRWLEDMSFEAEVNEHIFIMDADESNGGHNKGPRPKPLTLASLAGCTGMDVISILKKMHIEPEYFNIIVEGNLTEEHPKYYNKIKLIYEIKGAKVELEKVEKAIILSQEKYCGVSALLNKGAEIEYEIRML
ncbi:MAG TPA: OsmC family protein [Bacteroidales bacterium]|nr:OsmC family protein [Bacteroidales bacterium]HPS16552.1 OsmC family protein [Bacteroidales bacterium]